MIHARLYKLKCECGARATMAQDAAANCHCDFECAMCGDMADGIYTGDPACQTCADMEENWSEPDDPGEPMEPIIRKTDKGDLYDEDQMEKSA